MCEEDFEAISALTARCKFKKLLQKIATDWQSKTCAENCHLFILLDINFPPNNAALKAGFHMIADRNKVCDRLRSYGNYFCDRLRSCDRDRRRSQKIEPCSI